MYKKIIGYTAGVFDLFHIGHLNLLRNAKEMCDILIVGCSTDEVVMQNKNKKPVIPYQERVEILESIKYVDVVVAQNKVDYDNRLKSWEKYKFDIMFVGDDWQGTPKWEKLEHDFSKVVDGGVKIIYFPYTKSTSSTKINGILEKFR